MENEVPLLVVWYQRGTVVLTLHGDWEAGESVTQTIWDVAAAEAARAPTQ
jgi:hypothetical protein